MKVNNIDYRTVWYQDDKVYLINQNLLPFEFKIFEAKTCNDTCFAIKTMIVRGAGAIGAAAGFAMAQAAQALKKQDENYIDYITSAKNEIERTRPTAQNLFMAVNKVFEAALISPQDAIRTAFAIADKDAEDSRNIGILGDTLIQKNWKIATHCNAGWLAFVDHGTALSPIYEAHKNNKNIFVWADETRPRGQGARLTAWELNAQNIPHKIIPDNATAHLMSLKMIDMMIVGADRIARNGDTANKIGTLEKAICAYNYNIPFYVAAPTSTIDINCDNGQKIPIELRSEDEVLFQTGVNEQGKMEKILVCSPDSHAYNPAFDVTPAKLITGIITEKGIISANEQDIVKIMRNN